MKRGMPSGGHHSPTAFIFLVNSHSKKSLFLLTMGLAGRILLLALIFSKAPPRYPPHHGAHWAYTPESTGIRKGTPPPERLKSLKKRFGRILTDWFGSPARDTLHTGGSAKSRLSSVIAQEQMCAKLRTLPSRVKHISLFEKSAIFSWRTAGMLFHESRKIEFRTESKFSRHLSQSN